MYEPQMQTLGETEKGRMSSEWKKSCDCSKHIEQFVCRLSHWIICSIVQIMSCFNQCYVHWISITPAFCVCVWPFLVDCSIHYAFLTEYANLPLLLFVSLLIVCSSHLSVHVKHRWTSKIVDRFGMNWSNIKTTHCHDFFEQLTENVNLLLASSIVT